MELPYSYSNVYIERDRERNKFVNWKDVESEVASSIFPSHVCHVNFVKIWLLNLEVNKKKRKEK